MPNCSKNNDQLKQNMSMSCVQNGLDNSSTILQTASLMRKSVLLSPTFIPDVVNMPGEIEMACADNYQKITTNFKENVDSNAMNIIHNITETDFTVTNSHHKSEKEIQPIKNGKKHNNNVVDGIDTLLDIRKPETRATKIMEPIAPLKDTDNFVMDILEMTYEPMATDDHPDEASSSDCSNNNPELAFIGHPENSPTQANIELNNKISIISEQILSPSQFTELKYLHNNNSNINNFQPTPINCLITTNKLTDDSNQNTRTGFPANFCKPHQNLESISKETNSTLQNNYQNSETILMYDDKGVIINPENCNGNVDVAFPVHIIGNEYLTLDEKYTVAEEILGDVDNTGNLSADSNFDVCLEFNVSDIEKHLEENEEILESFVNEITGSDAQTIIDNLENSEDSHSKKPREVTIVTDIPSVEFESYPATNICQLKTNQNQSNKNEIDAYKLATLGDHYNSKNNNRSAAMYDPSQGIVKVKTSHGSEFVNQNVPEDDAVIKTINVPQPVKNSISKNSDDKFTINSCEIQNSKYFIKPEGSCALSLSVNIKTNKKNTCDINTIDKSKYCHQLKNNAEKETSASNKNCSKLTKIIVKEHNVNDGIDPTNNKQYTSDKVEEIAMLLRQITRRRSELVKPLCESIDHKCLHVKCQETYKPRSKMHIQGVEKPGGSESNDANINMNKVRIKTYKKCDKPKQRPEFTTKRIVTQDKVNNDLSSIVESSKYSQERISVDFCLCKDFGSLTCYGDERLYEHIHFLDHKKINCDSQFLFSIYNEEEIANENNIYLDIEQESPPTDAFSICWNNLLENEVTELKKSDHIDKPGDEINSNFTTNSNLNTEFEQYITDKVIMKSNESSLHTIEIKLKEGIPIFNRNCEPESNIDVQMTQSKAKTISDQMEILRKDTTREQTVGTKAHNNPTPKKFETRQLSENVEINLDSCCKGENEDNSLRLLKVRKKY